MDLAHVMKNLYENPAVKNYANNYYSDKYKKFVHISETATRYCPRTWLICEKMVKDIQTKPKELNKFTLLLKDYD
jgi:hypothetical protein